MKDQSITKVIGQMPGSTVAVFAGIHGNERAGVLAMNKVRQSIHVNKGVVYFVLANPEAVAQSVRYLEKNLNRLFDPGNTGQTIEDRRARELMKILDQSDALLDLHGYNGPEDEPFIITGKKGLEIAKRLDFRHVVSEISKAGDGATDCYMESIDKPGLCLECGSNFRPEQYVGLAEKSIYQFLQFYGLIDEIVPFNSVNQNTFNVKNIVIRQSDNFSFSRDYKNFDKLEADSVFARDGERAYVAKENEYIIFPRPNQKIGQEAFTIIEKK